MGDFMKYSHSKAMAVFYKIVKLVKNGVLMIKDTDTIKQMALHSKDIKPKVNL
jgi:hypothetical protein